MSDSATTGYIIPVYNESDILEQTIRDFSEFLSELGQEFEIVIVENGSTDGTRHQVKNLVEIYDFVSAAYLEKGDYGEALKKGFDLTPHEQNFFLNLDWWDRQFIRQSISELEQFDLIVGAKTLPSSVDNRSTYRKFLTWGLNTLLSILVGFRGGETHGLKAFNKSAIEDLIQKTELRRGMFDTELVLRAQYEGISMKELPVVLDDDRPARNWMIKKIIQNVVDIVCLTWIIRRDYGWILPSGEPIRGE